MLKIPLYSNEKLLLALEYGIILSETAKQKNIELTPKMIEKMEGIILNEFQTKNVSRVALDMLPNILAVFEVN